MPKYYVKYTDTVYHDVLVEAPSPEAAFQQVAYGYTTPDVEAKIIWDDSDHEMITGEYDVWEEGTPSYTSETFRV